MSPKAAVEHAVNGKRFLLRLSSSYYYSSERHSAVPKECSHMLARRVYRRSLLAPRNTARLTAVWQRLDPVSATPRCIHCPVLGQFINEYQERRIIHKFVEFAFVCCALLLVLMSCSFEFEGHLFVRNIQGLFQMRIVSTIRRNQLILDLSSRYKYGFVVTIVRRHSLSVVVQMLFPFCLLPRIRSFLVAAGTTP